MQPETALRSKRFIVVQEIRGRFETALVEAMRQFEMGDPTSENSARTAGGSKAGRIHAQVTASIAKGANLLLGGVLKNPGPGTRRRFLASVRKDNPRHDDVDPVAAIIEAEDEADAIRIANDSAFGLGSGVLTSNFERGRRIAEFELEAGMSFVNENVRSDPRAPFGGVKQSGYGRECSSFGIREFVNIKTVHVGFGQHGGQKHDAVDTSAQFLSVSPSSA